MKRKATKKLDPKPIKLPYLVVTSYLQSHMRPAITILEDVGVAIHRVWAKDPEEAERIVAKDLLDGRRRWAHTILRQLAIGVTDVTADGFVARGKSR